MPHLLQKKSICFQNICIKYDVHILTRVIQNKKKPSFVYFHLILSFQNKILSDMYVLLSNISIVIAEDANKMASFSQSFLTKTAITWWFFIKISILLKDFNIFHNFCINIFLDIEIFLSSTHIFVRRRSYIADVFLLGISSLLYTV